MRTSLPTFLLLAVACGTDPVVQENKALPPVVNAAPEPAPGPVPIEDTGSLNQAPDTTETAKSRPKAQPTPLDDCAGEQGVVNDVGRIILYVPKKQLTSRRSEVHAHLEGLYLLAERNAPHAIADDFEHGVSTERSSMPDTLPVNVLVYERCRSTEPHTVLQLRVWRDTSGGFGSDGW